MQLCGLVRQRRTAKGDNKHNVKLQLRAQWHCRKLNKQISISIQWCSQDSDQQDQDQDSEFQDQDQDQDFVAQDQDQDSGSRLKLNDKDVLIKKLHKSTAVIVMSDN